MRLAPLSAAALFVLIAVLPLASVPSARAQSVTLDTEPFASGFNQPIDVTHAGDGSGRLFVYQKTGQIVVLDADGARLGRFLDLSSEVTTRSERGLLGLAFAPDYASSGRFYVNYSNSDGDNVIARYTMASPASNDASDAPEEILLTVEQPATNHNGGDMAFGPDGLLYVASGDGGGSNDPGAYSQNPSSLLGKILRLDVSGPTGYRAAGNYPGAAPEVYAAGLRNPWRMSFDGDELYIGDVGQGAREEIDRVDVTTATAPNFGWVCFEGSRDNTGVASAARSDCQAYDTYAAPYYEYDHGVGQSVTGGVVYRGTQYPALQGYYVFADYRSDAGFAVRGEGADQEVVIEDAFMGNVTGFGTDEQGEVYVVSIFGEVRRLVSNVALPVTLVALDATRAPDCTARVTWTSAEESDLSHYEVQLAGEDLSWGAFAKTAAAGDGAYAVDVRPRPGDRYARLVAVDEDGTLDYSPTVALAACASAFRVHPSVVTAGQSIGVRTANTTTAIEIVDAAGRIVRRINPTPLAEGTRITLPITDLAGGVYVVRQGSATARLLVTE